MDVDGLIVSLYINTLLAEGYELDYKRSQDPEGCEEGSCMISGSLYFKKKYRNISELMLKQKGLSESIKEPK